MNRKRGKRLISTPYKRPAPARWKRLVLILAVIAVLVLGGALAVRFFRSSRAPKTHIQRLELCESASSVWDYYEENIQGTWRESAGRRVLTDKLEGFLSDGTELSYLLLYDPPLLGNYLDFLDGLERNDRNDRLRAAYRGLEAVSRQLTSTADIHAAPADYYGSTVTSASYIQNSDPARRTFRLGKLEVYYGRLADEGLWQESVSGFVLVTGVVRRYSNSENAYISANSIQNLTDVDWAGMAQ